MTEPLKIRKVCKKCGKYFMSDTCINHTRPKTINHTCPKCRKHKMVGNQYGHVGLIATMLNKMKKTNK